MAVNPVNMTLQEWADAIVLSTNTGYSLGRLDDPDRWREWAKAFCAAPGFAQRNPPNPYQFADWRDWAMLAYPMLEEVV